MLGSTAFRAILTDCRSSVKYVQLSPMASRPVQPVRLYHILRTNERTPAVAGRGLSRPSPRWRATPLWLSAHCQSTGTLDADYIPSPPRPPGSDQLAATPISPTAPSGTTDTVADIVEPLQQLNALGEPALASLGLGGWTPPGMFQQFFEMLHVSVGLPWWGAIAVGTVVLRLCMFPLVVKAQKNAVVMNNNLPRLQSLHMKMIESRQMGNEMEAARWSNELMLFMREKEVNPLKSMLVPMAQIPVFVSVFFGLRQLTNVPLVSLKDGGMLWFTDLVVPDPYCLLPAITSLTMLATIELGAEGGKVSTGPNQHLVRYVLRAMPFVIFPLTMNFPAAILCYWVCSNLVALNQVLFLKIPAVRNYFKIPAKIKHDDEKLPIKKKPFVAGVKESWNNMKISKDLEDRQRYDEMRFKKSGLGPVTKTYSYDPTRQNPDGSPRQK